MELVAPKGAVFDYAAIGLLLASGEITLEKLDLNFLHWARSCFAALLSKKAGDLPRNSFKLTGVSTRHPPPVTIKHFLREEPRPAVISSSSEVRYGLPRRSDGKPGNSARNTLCRIVIVSLQAVGDFKPFSKRRASLSQHSLTRSGSTDLFSKAAMISSGKCSAGSHVFSLGE